MDNLYSNFITNQKQVHDNLNTIVAKHLIKPYLKPISSSQGEIFKKIDSIVKISKLPIILDSCVGTGMSTIALSRLFPNHLIIGIDKSIHRLSKNKNWQDNNYILLQANVIDLWLLIAQSKWPITHHFIFYPNPYPKKTQLKRRFYAHPIFPHLLSLSPNLEVRTNWLIYAKELEVSLKLAGKNVLCRDFKPRNPISLFEKKYLETNTPTYQVIASEKLF